MLENSRVVGKATRRLAAQYRAVCLAAGLEPAPGSLGQGSKNKATRGLGETRAMGAQVGTHLQSCHVFLRASHMTLVVGGLESV